MNHKKSDDNCTLEVLDDEDVILIEDEISKLDEFTNKREALIRKEIGKISKNLNLNERSCKKCEFVAKNKTTLKEHIEVWHKEMLEKGENNLAEVLKMMKEDRKNDRDDARKLLVEV